MENNRSLDQLIPLNQALQQLNLDLSSFFRLVEEGKLYAGKLENGEIYVGYQSISELLPKEALPEYKENENLQGVPISISDASLKYGIATPTITRWMQRGLIRRLGKDGRKTLLDEADVAYCARIYLSNSGQGKWNFSSNGRPYKK